MRISVRVTPNSARDEIAGPAGDNAGRSFLKVKIRAIPEDGKANRAVEKLLAKALGLPKSAVQVVTGATSRIKGVEIETGPQSDAARQIEEWMGDG